jgi:hypothetical protein
VGKRDRNRMEAEFRMIKIEYSANFNNQGAWKETEYEIEPSDLPAEIRSILDKNCRDYEVEKLETSETSSGKFYELEIERRDEEFNVLIDSKGILTKEKSEEKDKD